MEPLFTQDPFQGEVHNCRGALCNLPLPGDSYLIAVDPVYTALLDLEICVLMKTVESNVEEQP